MGKNENAAWVSLPADKNNVPARMRLRGTVGAGTISLMLRVTLFFITVTAYMVAQAQVRIDVPPSAYIDGEASAEAALGGWAWEPAKGRTTLKVVLSLDNMSAADNAELALGETTVGFDRGEWFVLGDRMRVRLSATPSLPASGRRSLVVRVRLDAGGAPLGASLVADGSPLAFGVGVPLSWLDPAVWGALRVTARGGAENVSVTAARHADGSVMILR